MNSAVVRCAKPSKTTDEGSATMDWLDDRNLVAHLLALRVHHVTPCHDSHSC